MASLANLALRRRCLFLVDVDFMRHEHTHLTHSDSHRAETQQALQRAIHKVAATVPASVNEANADLVTSVRDAVGQLSRAAAELGVDNVDIKTLFAKWEDAIESLLFFLDQMSAGEMRSGGVASPLLADCAALAEAVRRGLCGIVTALHADGQTYYDAHEDTDASTHDLSLCTARDNHSATGRVACAWSIGAPVAEDVYEFFNAAFTT